MGTQYKDDPVRFSAWVKKSKSRPEFKASEAQRMARRRLAEPEKYAARTLLRYALRRGQITRPTSCEDCGITCKPNGHHDDYTKPLEVKWLCAHCHVAEHRKAKGESVTEEKSA
jgi:hypothetical protein